MNELAEKTIFHFSTVRFGIIVLVLLAVHAVAFIFVFLVLGAGWPPPESRLSAPMRMLELLAMATLSPYIYFWKHAPLSHAAIFLFESVLVNLFIGLWQRHEAKRHLRRERVRM